MLTALILITLPLSPEPTVRVVAAPPLGGSNLYYAGNAEPLAPSPFRKLPVGAVRPKGWIEQQLRLQADGFIGHLPEISKFLEKKDNAWLSPTGEGKNGWEEVPYWLKGFGDTGYLLGDQRIIDEARVWIEGVLSSQRADGYFGPQANRVANKGAADVWPNMPMLNALQSYWEFTEDERVLGFMSRYFKWQLSIPDEQMFLSYWEKHRGGDNMASVYWLYNRTREPFLLDLVHKIHKNGADWVSGIPDFHGVNFAQAFREPAQYSLLSKSAQHLAATEKDYRAMRKMYGQVPGGMYGADENARPGFDDPRQAAETCAMVEMMLSHEMLMVQTGDRVWAERCEDVAFNSLPASMTADLKALRYLTSPNMAASDASSKAPGLQNGGPMLLMDPRDHRCCQHNVSHGWPYFAEHLWLATDNDGLGVALYGPSVVTAKVNGDVEVRIEEDTSYPFEEQVRFRFTTARPVKFPLTLRLPSWSDKPSLSLNGKALTMRGKGAWAIVDNEWKTGDVLVLSFPMKQRVEKLPKGAVALSRGPLTYSLAIPEKVVVKRSEAKWPAVELWPSAPWNYGLDGFSASFRQGRVSGVNPWTLEGTPVKMMAKGRRIPGWQLDMFGLVDMLQPSPARTTQRLEELTLVPMGAARLRISAFPTVSTERGTDWKAPQRPKPSLPATASHIFRADTLTALSDGLIPKSSHDQFVPRFTWWDHKGTTEWVQYDLPRAIDVSEAQVYWFDDGKLGGGCGVPASWTLTYLDGETWRPVQARSSYGVARDRMNVVKFEKVRSAKFRIEAKLQPGFSSGILEWSLK